MDTPDIAPTLEKLLSKMKKDGYSDSVLHTTSWIINHFETYCKSNNISTISVSHLVRFCSEMFGFDYYNPDCPMQTVLRRPLLILFEFYECGSYEKSHQQGSFTDVPLCYSSFYVKYRDFINVLPTCGLKTKKRKLWIMINYLKYLTEKGTLNTWDIQLTDAHEYVNSLTHFAESTKRTVKSTIREAYDWMFDNHMLQFSGRMAFPLIRKDPRTSILSYYSKEEIELLLQSIDRTTSTGKMTAAIASTLYFLGIRSSDLINLKFENIDWTKREVNIIQEKTGVPLQLPIIEEVELALLDYIKNARNNSESDSEYVFITAHAPYTKFADTSSIHRYVQKAFDAASINYEGKHHGPHSLRHSFAANLMAENIPISSISNVLGHTTTTSTEHYLTVDETHLKELTLEVPHVF